MDIYQHDDSFREKGLSSSLYWWSRRGLLQALLWRQLRFCLRSQNKRTSWFKKSTWTWEDTSFLDVLSCSLDIGIGIVEHDEIDRINILQATRLAMKKAVNDLRSTPDALIIDAVTCLRKNKTILNYKGWFKSASVAAASIIAKYVRDMIMLHYHALYPEYNFKKHKGYCTEEHIHLINSMAPAVFTESLLKRLWNSPFLFNAVFSIV